MEGVEIRQATMDDKAAVLAIHENLWDGQDYLEDVYDTFISCPHSTPYVLVYADRIVSFAAAFLVDDGTTVISRGARTMDKFAGKGFYKMLAQHCLKKSGARVLAFTTNNTNKAISSSTFQRGNKHIMSREFLRYDFDVNNLQVKPYVQNSIGCLTEQLLESYFTKETFRHYLFPQDRIIANWVPFKLFPSNIPILWEWILLDDNTSLALSDVRSQNGVITGLVSIATTYNSTGGFFMVNVDIYGNDTSALKGHLVAHMEFVCEKAGKPVTMWIFCDHRISQFVKTIFCEYHVAEVK